MYLSSQDPLGAVGPKSNAFLGSYIASILGETPIPPTLANPWSQEQLHRHIQQRREGRGGQGAPAPVPAWGSPQLPPFLGA